MPNTPSLPDSGPAPTPGADKALVEAKDLGRYFDVSPPLLNRLLERRGRIFVKAVDGITFKINRGETFSLVGESGCGKSTVGHLLVGLYRPTRGEILFEGVRLGGESRRKHAAIQSRMQMIFQDPYASLNPRWRVSKIIGEPIEVIGESAERNRLRETVGKLLTQVGLAPGDGEKYPHEFSGGQRQRISIARALAGKPEFIVCDEPTSALDVSVQAQILNLMKGLQRRLGLTYLFISHDLAVVYHISTSVGVMYLGRLAEWSDTKTPFKSPRHPYTRMLLDAIPDLSMTGRRRTPVAGEVPSPINPPPGCAFHPRCPHANPRCSAERPQLMETGRSHVACHAVAEKRI
ncbi:MAG: ATP-binding cassette domain-containing protein [Desulfobacterales bacterium]|nr:ATP-binding cassette domain-containing protein [Desulfobacterales bacterium]